MKPARNPSLSSTGAFVSYVEFSSTAAPRLSSSSAAPVLLPDPLLPAIETIEGPQTGSAPPNLLGR
jgi:hypothetical protein